MLYELCEAFGDYREDPVKESNNEEVARDEQTAESILERRERRTKRFGKKDKNIDETVLGSINVDEEETVEEDETDVLFEDVDVSLEDISLEDVVLDVLDDDVNLEDVSLEDLVLDVPDDVADEDDDTDDDDHQEIEVNEAVYDDMEEMDESSLLKLLEEYDSEKNHNGHIPFEFKAAIELSSMLRNSNASFRLYGKIISWAEQFVVGIKSEKFPTQEAVIKMLSKRYHLDCLKPYQNPCVMPTTNLEFNVITHNFIASIFLLLTDEELMRPEILIFDD